LDKENDYYQYVVDTLAPRQVTPFVVIDSNISPILAPLVKGNIDLQIYHPRTQYINDRPSWLIRDRHFYPVPQPLKKWTGQLLSIVPVEYPEDAVPTDQFVLRQEDQQMLLYPGQYRARIIDCSGTIVASYNLVVD